MRNLAYLVALAALVAPSVRAQSPTQSPLRPVHTYSIVARDPATGQMGVAVQSHWYSVGPLVAWAEAGVGAIATQSFVDPSYGALGLDLMRGGKTAPEALKALLAADSSTGGRQVAMVDAKGGVASFTGPSCIVAAGHHTGDQYSTQANMMLRDTVWPAMARAFESSKGDLADRLLAALEAAEREGGDIRGRQSAAIVVVSGTNTGRPWVDRVFDLRVEDNPAPVAELKRLVGLKRAYDRMNHGDELMTAKDFEGAMREYAAAEAAVPDNVEMTFWHAVGLVHAGRVDDAIPMLRRVFARDPNWAKLLERLPKAGLLPDDPKLMERLLQK